MRIHYESCVAGACLVATVLLFASPVCASPQDYDIEQALDQPPATGKVHVKVHNLKSNTAVTGAVIHGDASVGPRSLGTPTMILHMIARPASAPGQYTFKIEPGMQVFDIDVGADIPGETATVAKKIQVNDQGGNGQGQNGQGQNGQGQNGQGAQ